MNVCSWVGAWTKRTSALPCWPIVRACPVPTATVFTVWPDAFSSAGTRTSRRPESWSEVVVARIRFVDPTGDAAADAAAALALADGALACGLGDEPELHAAAATSATATRPANRARTVRFEIVTPETIVVLLGPKHGLSSVDP